MREQYIGTLKYREKTGDSLDPTKEEVLSSYDDFQRAKLTFLNECYISIKTMIAYWTLYNNNLHFDEVNKGKDLKFFSTSELQVLIKSTFGMDTTKASIGSFLNMYYRWADNRGDISVNPYLGIDTASIKTNSKRMLESKLYGQKQFYQLCKEMEKHTKLPNIIPFILARYGIAGEKLYYMRYLKWEDIDRKNLIVNIVKRYIDENGNPIEKLISKLPVDFEFIKWIDKAKNYTETTEEELNQDGQDVKKKNRVRYADYGYVLKKAIDANATEEEKVNKYNTLYNRAKIACLDLGIKRIAFKDLVRTRQLELLLQIRKKHRLTSKDFDNIIDLFALEDEKIISNRSFTLRKRYEELTGDAVILRKEANEEDNKDSLTIADKLIKELELEIC